MPKNQEDLVQSILEGLRELEPNSPQVDPLASYLYIAKPQLSGALNKFSTYLNKTSTTDQEKQDAGYLLEEIVLLAFAGLKGFTNIKNFQSAGPQYDLLISGDTLDWLSICRLLSLPTEFRTIVVEAKARTSKVNDQQFSRLCSIMQQNLINAGIGIFFSINGATGFPTNVSRQRKLGDSRLRQVIFYANTKKAIVVFDINDIMCLSKNGSLITLLIRKIRDIQELSGLSISNIGEVSEVDLPPRLQSVYQQICC